MDKSEVKPKKVKSDKQHGRDKKKIACITTFVIGMITLIVGVVFLVLGLTGKAAVADGEYLVDAGNWTLTDCNEDDCDEVVWDFTEIGKGKLTTDGHAHDWDFAWALEDGKMIIKTDWLYELDDEYEYSLDQNTGVLTLKNDDAEYRFVVQP